MLRRASTPAFWLLLSATSCGGSSPEPEDPFAGKGRFFQAPAKPGASLNASEKCECYACDPPSCCGGGDESTGSEGCAEGTDFSRCDLSVKSCTSRCFHKVWRVPRGEDCAVRRPEECCAGG
jgi:hypothetical protein